MTKRLAKYYLILVYFSLSTFAQESGDKATSYKTSIFIHTSKIQYHPGEKIWMSAYLINSNSNNLLNYTHPLYVQLYSSKGLLVLSQIIYTNLGRGNGLLALGRSFAPGIYRLRAFTQYMFIRHEEHFEKLIYIGVQPIITQIKPIENYKFHELKIELDSITYNKRQPVELRIKANINANVSVSVYKETAWLPVDLPFLSLKKPSGEFEEQRENLIFMGRAIRPKGDAIVNGQVILLINNETYFSRTDSSGFFIFNDLDFEGELTTFWQVNNKNGRPISDAIIRWIKFPKVSNEIDSLVYQTDIKEINYSPVYKPDGDSLNTNIKHLDELIVRATKTDNLFMGVPVLHKPTDVSYAVNFQNNQLPNSIDGEGFKSMLRQLPTCFHGDPPKYLLDGMSVSNPSEVIDLRQIKRIELLKGTNGWVYGSTCVYAIYTYNIEKESNMLSASSNTFKMNFYQPNQKFHILDHYKTNQIEGDNRQTLYWNPEIQIKQENIKLHFFTSDLRGEYRIVIQGISNQGPIYSEAKFKVE